ncbi:MAG TPA: M48 family metalloprotease [Candidatus Dormibacteraeota bacterium]|nr:M48 family metalloprotease [Candidatus Dormibacteraeota bacterium]
MPAATQNPTPAAPPADKFQLPSQGPARKALSFDEFVDSAILQERRLTKLMRNFKLVVETYVQEEKQDSGGNTSPKDDHYFLSRLDLTGNAPASRRFEISEHSKHKRKKKFPKSAAAFAAGGFAQSVFPDLDHFDRQNYNFEFVRWEILGEVRCVVIDVTPREGSANRGFVGRIWVEDQDFNIVRFTGTYTSKAYSKRSFHFDSWRLNTLGIMWMPAYVYTQESDPHASNRGLWFKAQTRVWGYDLAHAGDHREYAKPLTDNPAGVDPNRHEASQDVSPHLTLGRTTYTREDEVVERLQVAGLMAPDGDVDRILETVVNNLLIVNNLDLAGVRCRVLLTTPLESFVVGRTIVVSRGLLDVLPDEAALAAVLAHELAHIVLQHSLGAQYSSQFNSRFSDLELFARLNFSFDPAKEADADSKGEELFSKSPYKDKAASVALFLQALEARSRQLPGLLHARLSNDFERSHLVGMQAIVNPPQPLQVSPPDQIAALPLGSRIKVDPWSDRIEMVKGKPPVLLSASENRPFEVSPFFPYLRRLDEQKPQAGMNP